MPLHVRNRRVPKYSKLWWALEYQRRRSLRRAVQRYFALDRPVVDDDSIGIASASTSSSSVSSSPPTERKKSSGGDGRSSEQLDSRSLATPFKSASSDSDCDVSKTVDSSSSSWESMSESDLFADYPVEGVPDTSFMPSPKSEAEVDRDERPAFDELDIHLATFESQPCQAVIRTTLPSISNLLEDGGPSQESPMFLPCNMSAIHQEPNEHEDVKLIKVDDNNCLILFEFNTDSPYHLIISHGNARLTLLYGELTVNNCALTKNEPVSLSIGLLEQVLFLRHVANYSPFKNPVPAPVVIDQQPFLTDSNKVRVKEELKTMKRDYAILHAAREESTKLSWIEWKAPSRPLLDEDDDYWIGVKYRSLPPPVDPYWMSTVTEIAEKLHVTSVVMVIGTKSSGKSSFLRWTINEAISRWRKSFIYVDADPGQTEFSPPGQLQATLVTAPLLSPPFINIANLPKGQIIAASAVGGVAMQMNPTLYVSAFRAVWAKVKEAVQQKPRPICINTMGWTNGVGGEMLVDIIRTVTPNMVVELVPAGDLNPSGNGDEETSEYSAENVNNARSWTGYFDVVFYEYIKLVRSSNISQRPRNSREARELAMLGYLSHCVDLMYKPIADVSRKKMDLATVFVHCVCDYPLTLEIAVKSLDFSWVQLCRTRDNVQLTEGPKLENDVDGNELIGCAYVMAMDRVNNHIEVVTPVPQDALSQVNLLIRPTGIDLPKRLLDDVVESIKIKRVVSEL